MTAQRNPRVEASALLPESFEARVLEPSPPASTDPEWYADDPTDPAGATDRLVTPIDGEDLTWSAVAKSNPSLSPYVADHWLGAYRRLEPLPDRFGETRRALHELAYFALAPKRFSETGKLGLRYTYRGFGTPFFGDDEQVRVERDQLVYVNSVGARTTPITNLMSAAAFLGIPLREVWFDGFHDPLEPPDPDARLPVDATASDAIGEWFGFGASVLEQARRTPGADDVSRVQLWPEHFDLAFEMGAGDRRASYGASPGDAGHPEPYLYIAAWGSIDRSDPYWNDTTFNGASLPYEDLLAAQDQRRAALDFFRQGYERLNDE